MRIKELTDLARWSWQIHMHTEWRRPPYRGALGLVAQLGLTGALIWAALLPETAALMPSAGALVAMLTAMRAIFSLLNGAGLVRNQLLVHGILPRIHTAPVAPAAWVGAQMAPGAVSALLQGVWVGAVVALVAPDPWAPRLAWAVLGLFAAVNAGLIGLVLGTLSMLWWARRYPQWLTVGMIAVALAQLGAGALALSEVLQGRDPGLIYQAGLLLPALSLSVPGMLLLLRRVDIGRLYHETWLNLKEQATTSGPTRSASLLLQRVMRKESAFLFEERPPEVRAGLAGVIARDWVALVRNPLGKTRIALAALMLLAAPLAGRALAGTGAAAFWLTAAPLLLWYIAPSEWIGAAFTGEGPSLNWYRLTPVPPARILWAKWFGFILPSALLGGLAGLLLALGAGAPANSALFSFLACLGAGTVMIGFAACSPTAASSWKGEDQMRAWVGEQIPRSPGAVVGYAVSVAYLALWLWSGRGIGGDVALGALPLIAMIAGAARLSATWTPRAGAVTPRRPPETQRSAG